ncbi:cysteine hydrolase [Natronobacterium texcoconense]|uniref:Nicotinamidase-related amidase n=1 Tax=Natronobacterium texcoconense TaxID=1095778 RepID=A0A1H1FDR0_NATTX|nr:cysteine hydrolase [Natronobacterium texcoconense]SDQ99071.1 Nicotinamidase-related amidase [Natronobacterium texcoconense]
MGDITIDPRNTAVLFTDPQVDALKPEGVMWDQVGDLVEEHDVVSKLERLQDAAREGDVPVFYSPHYYDDDEFESWEELNGIDQKMFDAEMYHVDGEGSNIIPELEPDDNTFVLSSHKHLSGFWANDIQAQFTKRGIDTIVIAGMFANLCVESHIRDAIENGFKVVAVTDATAAPGEDFLEAAKTNAEMLAHETAQTDDVVDRLRNAPQTSPIEAEE